jgi:hypothetical protein
MSQGFGLLARPEHFLMKGQLWQRPTVRPANRPFRRAALSALVSIQYDCTIFRRNSNAIRSRTNSSSDP